MKLLGFITRNTKHFPNIFTLKNLFCSIVRSGLEYASPVWSPHCKIHIQTLERVERKFVRYVAFQLHIPIMNLSYEHIYFTLHLLPLSLRKEQSDFLFLYSLINHGINSSQLLEIVTFSINTRMTRNPRLFFYSVPINTPISNTQVWIGFWRLEIIIGMWTYSGLRGLKLRSILWVTLWTTHFLEYVIIVYLL